MPPTPALRPELLAPAGDWDALRAAVANGADSVYFGLDRFNARHRATNFTLDELPRVMDYLHAHNVKGFLTFNTLIFSDELESALEYIQAVASAGVDAVIVQDLGIAKLIHTLAPSLHIHGSTQMTLTEPEGIKFVQQLGVQRVVLARELGLNEIKKITAATDMPLEVFVHGALCVAYSGQCLTSESLGGRSANRGQCAQACRLPYQLLVDGTLKDLGDKAYLLSPSDLAAHDLIGELTDLGVASFKIEGRLKSAHYVAATTQTYRAAIDAKISNLKFEISQQHSHDLEQTFSRGFTHGFLSGVNHQQLVTAKYSKARGTKIGTVLSKTTHSITIKPSVPRPSGSADSPLKPGDGILFDENRPEQDEQGGRIYAVRALPNNQLELQFREGDLNFAAISPGALVWKTDDPALKRRLEHSFSRDTIARRVKLHFTVMAHVGQTLEVTAVDDEGRTATATWKPLEKAHKFPATKESIKEQIDRLGDTPFELADLTIDESDGPMIPKSVLNDLRRQVVEKLLTHRTRNHKIENPHALESLRSAIPPFSIQNSEFNLSLHLLVRTLDQLTAVLSHNSPLKPTTIYADFEDVRRYPEAITRCRAAGIKIALATLRIVKPGEEGFLKQVSDCNPDALLVRCLGAIHYYQHHAPHLPLIGDYALNIANELTAQIFTDAGLVRIVPSYDLNWTQLAAMLRRFDPSKCETVLHQHMPMFHMEHCVFAHTLSNGKDFHDCGRPCEKHKVDLIDARRAAGGDGGEPHPLIPDVGCRNTLFNAKAQTAAEYLPDLQKLGIRHFRIELLRESAEETTRLLDRYTRLLTGHEKPLDTIRSLRVLNQLGVTRGTLAHE